jgi:hypothetical protein
MKSSELEDSAFNLLSIFFASFAVCLSFPDLFDQSSQYNEEFRYTVFPVIH